MILVDELVAVGKTDVHCRATPRRESLFYDADSRAVPGYVGVELMAQSVAGWSGYHSWKQGKPPAIGFLLGCRSYQASCSSFKEGMVLDIYAGQLMESNGVAVFSCRIEHQGVELASCQLSTYVPSPEQLGKMLRRK